MKKCFRLVALSLFVAFAAATVLAFVTLGRPDSSEREFSLMLAGRINDTVMYEILRPLLVARTLGSYPAISDWFLAESEHSLEENVAYMQRCLSAVKEQFGYTSAFLVSDASHCYYTYKGLHKIINPLDDPHDMWYPTFLKKNVAYDIEADEDQVNGTRWTVFVNCRVTSPDGRLLGVCGVGVTMENLQKLLESYEKQHNVKINLVDANGLVQLASNASEIQRLYLNNIRLDPENDTYAVIQNAHGFRISKFLQELGWYLVIQTGKQKTGYKMLPLVLANCVAFFGLLLLAFFLSQLSTADVAARSRDAGSIDVLTGLPNRNYFTEAYGEAGVFNTTRYKTIAVFDIDRFTAESAVRNGNDIIQSVAHIAQRLFEEHGLILHWGGDTFLLLLELDMSEALIHCRSLCALIREEVHVTVSVGLARVELVDSIKKNFHRAAQACYAAKAADGNRVMLGGGY